MSSSSPYKEWLLPVISGLAVAGSLVVTSLATRRLHTDKQEKDNSLRRMLSAIQNVNRLMQRCIFSDGKGQVEEDMNRGGHDKKQQQQKVDKKFDTVNNLEPEIVLMKQMSSTTWQLLDSSQQQVIKICITGGPCGGKTSALVLVAKRLQEEGFKVFIVPEAATMIAKAGGMINMMNYTEQQAITFQKSLIKAQIQLEDSFVGIAKLSTSKSVVLCDRGLMDGSAYMSSSSWNTMLGQMELSEVLIRDKRYDCVIHLVTAADGAEDSYNKNNEVRHESPAEAIMVDRKLQIAWLGHPNYAIIDNTSVKSFEEKLNKLVNKVRITVGLEGRLIKLQKRFMLEDSFVLQKLEVDGNPLKCQRFFIEDNYIQHNLPLENSGHKIYTKLRRYGQSNQYVYIWTQREYKDGEMIQQRRRKLTQQEYLLFLSNCDTHRSPLFKERICFVWENIFFVIDCFINSKEGLTLLKVKLQEGQTVKLPPFLKIARDVTDEKAYTGRVFSKKNWYAPNGDEDTLAFRKDSL